MSENTIEKLADNLISKEATRKGNVWLSGMDHCPGCGSSIKNQTDWENATGCLSCNKSFVE